MKDGEVPFSPFRNQNLFSTHYLSTHLSEEPLWARETGQRLLNEVTAIFRREEEHLEHLKEGQIEHHFFRSVFAALGSPRPRSLSCCCSDKRPRSY